MGIPIRLWICFLRGEQCRLKLVQWSKDLNPSKLIEKAHKRKMELRKGVQNRTNRDELAQLTGELEKLYHDQAMCWRQRGNATWMKDQNKNTAYFHAKATTREQFNKIRGLRNEHGTWVDRKEEMEAIWWLKVKLVAATMECVCCRRRWKMERTRRTRGSAENGTKSPYI